MARRPPDHKRRVDGVLLGGKDAQRAAKVYRATGAIKRDKATTQGATAGERRLGSSRIWKWLKGDD